MTADTLLADLAALAGILTDFHDLQGQQRITTPDTQRALLAANGIAARTEAEVRESLATHLARTHDRWFPEEIIIDSNRAQQLGFGLGATWHLRSDDSETDRQTDGETNCAEGQAGDAIALPALTSGVYEMTAHVAGRTETIRVIAAPPRLPSLETLTGRSRIWGLNLALYGLRSARNCGLGDFTDLGDAARAAARHGAAFVGINPVHNMGFCDDAISPYSPSHRGYLNASHIAPDAIAGLAGSGRAAALLAEAAPDFAALRTSWDVQYGPHKARHNALLDALFAAFTADAPDHIRAGFESFVQAGGAQLASFARFEALSELHGPDWRDWRQTQDPAPERIWFHLWLQWVADAQLHAAQDAARDAGMPLGLYLDLAVGPRRGGAESWCEQDTIARDVSIGAPPDHLSPGGQNWDLAAFSPHRLRAHNYRPLRRILANIMRRAGMVRIDHVLGLNRSFWLPDDGNPGGYIRQPFEALLALIRIEAERHGTLVVGEDLGLVPAGFRDTMRGCGFYGYSVLQYERDGQGRFRDAHNDAAQVLSCFATHDTPTIRGFEIGRDIDWWHRLGWIDDAAATQARADRTRDVADLTDRAPAADFTTGIHTLLAQSPAGLVTTQLDDILRHEETQNLPGTIDEHPNWRRKYAVPVDDLASDARLCAVGQVMADAGRTRTDSITKDNLP